MSIWVMRNLIPFSISHLRSAATLREVERIEVEEQHSTFITSDSGHLSLSIDTKLGIEALGIECVLVRKFKQTQVCV